MDPGEKVSAMLMLIGQPARIKILMVIARQEACVCHIEAALEMRQASISQHLMILRKAGVVSAHRIGRNIFYRINSNEVMDLIYQAARSVNVGAGEIDMLSHRPVKDCCCPQCNPGMDPNQTCRKRKYQIQ